MFPNNGKCVVQDCTRSSDQRKKKRLYKIIQDGDNHDNGNHCGYENRCQIFLMSKSDVSFISMGICNFGQQIHSSRSLGEAGGVLAKPVKTGIDSPINSYVDCPK